MSTRMWYVVAAIVVPFGIQTVAIVSENAVPTLPWRGTEYSLIVSLVAGVSILIKGLGWPGVAWSLLYAPLVGYLLAGYALAFAGLVYGKSL